MKELTNQYDKSLPSMVSKTTNADKKKQIVHCTRQLFDMQDTYGLTPEQLANRLRGIIEDVVEFDVVIINESFKKWRRSSPKIPTPFHIRKLCEEARAKNNTQKRLCDFDGDYTEYKKYINGLKVSKASQEDDE